MVDKNTTYLVSALFATFLIGYGEPVTKVIGGAIFIATIIVYGRYGQ